MPGQGGKPAGRWQRVEGACGRAGAIAGGRAVQGRCRPVGPTVARAVRRERLTVIRTAEASGRGRGDTLSNAAADVAVDRVDAPDAAHHRGEEVFAEGKGEVGLGQYEVHTLGRLASPYDVVVVGVVVIVGLRSSHPVEGGKR